MSVDAAVKKQVRSGRGPIVESAVRNFTERGYHGTSMRDIATGAGVTVASIYHHFASKQVILHELMVGTMRDLLGATSRAVAEADPSATARLDAFVRAWTVFHTTRQPEALIGASELRSLEPEGRAEVVALRDRQEHLLRDVVLDGCATGEFGIEHPVEAARIILTSGAAVSSWYRGDGALTPDELGDRFATLARSLVNAAN